MSNSPVGTQAKATVWYFATLNMTRQKKDENGFWGPPWARGIPKKPLKDQGAQTLWAVSRWHRNPGGFSFEITHPDLPTLTMSLLSPGRLCPRSSAQLQKPKRLFLFPNTAMCPLQLSPPMRQKSCCPFSCQGHSTGHFERRKCLCGLRFSVPVTDFCSLSAANQHPWHMAAAPGMGTTSSGCAGLSFLQKCVSGSWEQMNIQASLFG